ncbi:hypothetical protein P43SY_000471 [Pythium insidiosum]|uniref:Uncharacterized protein n=1 Tax=Pythium insidiosum TaxID=114742 RepID=A0AAD5Q3K8_PYTIN|nr:hypothetical protein P43SY_000471 [Pythium insidiosum]KAJ0396362.1 hypothetical protein ATCC90586_002261 [Pythium insidiosum]
MVIRKAARNHMGVMKLWTTDKSTFPLLFCAAFAATVGISTAVRAIFHSPDVCVSKTKRTTALHYTAEDGDQWRARRLEIAQGNPNRVNQTREFAEVLEKSAAKAPST